MECCLSKQITIPLRIFVEYFYNKTNVSELRKEIQTPPNITINTIYEAFRYGLFNPITSQFGFHYLLLGATIDTYHMTMEEYKEQSFCISNFYPNDIILIHHCTPIQRICKEDSIIPFVKQSDINPATTLVIYPYKTSQSPSNPITFDLLIIHINKSYAENIVIRLLLDSFTYFQQKNYRYTILSAHTAYELSAKQYFKTLSQKPQFYNAKKFLTGIDRESISNISTKYLPLLTSLTGKPMPLPELVKNIQRLTMLRNSLNHQDTSFSNTVIKEIRDCLISSFFICKYFELGIPDKDYSEFL